MTDPVETLVLARMRVLGDTREEAEAAARQLLERETRRVCASRGVSWIPPRGDQ